MNDNDKELEKAIDLLVKADGIMNIVLVTIVEYNRSARWGTFARVFHPLKDRISKWQFEFYKANLLPPSPSASPSPAQED